MSHVATSLPSTVALRHSHEIRLKLGSSERFQLNPLQPQEQWVECYEVQ